ncbi:MAG: BamA/TamA family outer membrane protein [Ignavibacterium sp.]|nr:BamA/TamA family outer membrane protein [Ignavibacterium sp.]
MIKFFFIVLISVFSGGSLFSQTDEKGGEESYPFIVDSILVSGNDITEEFIILRELTFTEGDTISFETADYNRERIYSLGIFNQVTLEPNTYNDLNILNIVVEESWYIYPIPFINIKESDWDKISFGMFLVLKNFRGRNETLSAVAGFGYDPTFGLSYYNPNMIGNEDIFFFTRMSYSDVSNKSLIAEQLALGNFDQKVITGNVEIGRRFFLFHKLALNLGFSYIESPFYIDRINASFERIDRVFTLSTGYQYDTRDLVQFPKSGFYTNVSYILKGMGINGINYNVARVDLRTYNRLIEKLHFKMRFTSRFTLGNRIPLYDNSIIGLEDKIRGFFNYKIEGNHSYLTSAELYYPIIEELKINLEFIPIIPKQLLSYRVALYAQIFADAGATQNSEASIGLNNFKSGYGAGLTVLILPHYVARIEYAINELRKPEIILDIGTSF